MHVLLIEIIILVVTKRFSILIGCREAELNAETTSMRKCNYKYHSAYRITNNQGAPKSISEDSVVCYIETVL